MKTATTFFKLSALSMIIALLLSSSTFAQCSGGSKSMGQGGETMMSTDDQSTDSMDTDVEESGMEDFYMEDSDIPPAPEPTDDAMPTESE